MVDVTKAIEPKSDQMNAEDFLPTGPGGARTFTITRVEVRDSPEQPISVWLAEFPQARPWKPAKTMAKLMRIAWSAESDNWIGKRVSLYCDPDVMFGRDKLGGIRISHMSGIGGRALTANLATTRGKRAPWTVEPIPDGAPAPSRAPGPLDQLVWAMNAAGVDPDPHARLAYCRGIVQRGIQTAADLTAEELAAVMAALQQPDSPSVPPAGDVASELPYEPTEAELAEIAEREIGGGQ
jgi:hypothetical protein